MASWSKLTRSFIVRPLRRDVTRTALTVLSIALGVAVVIAIELAGEAATGSFESSLTSLVGKVDYEITANGGVDERVLGKLAGLPINARFNPVIEQPVVIKGHGATTLYGIDTVALGNVDDIDNSVVVSKELADRFQWHEGSVVTLRGREFRIRSIVGGQNTGQHQEWIGADIGAVQELLGMAGKVDRIEVFNAGDAEDLIRAAIPSTYELQTPGARSQENRRMLAAFRWNLRILSYISLVVGAFLIYNTIAVSVVRRRAEIGILRAIGLGARGVMTIFLGEAMLLGLVGSVLGVVLGRGLAAVIVRMISDTVNALFVTSAPGAIALPIPSIALALAAGTGVSLLSALIPALEASRVAPAEAMRREAREHETRLHVRRDLAIAALLSAIAGLLCIPGFGYAATLFAIAATAMLSPAFVTGMIRICQRPLRRVAGAAGLIAGRSLVASLARTSIVVTALATAISMMVSVGIMVGSFRETVEVWLESSLQADIYLRAAGPATAGIDPPLDPAVAETVRATPGVGDLDVFHAFTFSYEGVRATFGAGIRRSLRFVAGGFPKAGQAVVSEPFANKHHVRVGDLLHIPLGSATAELRVAGIYYDYANDQGFVLVDQSTLLHYLPHQPATNIAIYVKPGADAVKVLHEIEARLAALPVMIAPNDVLRHGAVEVFDRTFAVTYALEAVAIIVAMLGAANSLLALVLDRRREIGLIRYLGADRGQVRSMILTEAGLLGLLAGLLGLGLGWVLSLVLIFVVNKQSFGWTIQFHPPLLLLGGALLLVWTVTVLAGVYPARFASRLEPAEVVHEE